MTAKAFTGEVVLVTGAAGGLGTAMVAAFAEAGATVIAADLDGPRGAASSPGGIAHRLLDVTDEAAWSALLDAVEDEFGPLSILVNNAGIYRPNIAFEDMPLDVWRQHFAVNSDGTFLGCKHAIRRMKASGTRGAIVNIGSGMSIRANPTGAAYCASKAAVLMTTRTAAGAAGPYGIRVNAVLPGAVPTDMLMGNMVEGEEEAGFLENLAAYSPMGRLASAEDIARAVLFLADPRNSAISGIHVPVDCGNMPGG